MPLKVLCQLLKHDALQQLGDEREIRNGWVDLQLVCIKIVLLELGHKYCHFYLGAGR